mmetsp:Transcript_18824/g.43383  ORF Transcript_18824/g.43383 Transcript_18824/m.43383 type:complete len:152 (-) Transcript_18824:29-484(-)
MCIVSYNSEQHHIGNRNGIKYARTTPPVISVVLDSSVASITNKQTNNSRQHRFLADTLCILFYSYMLLVHNSSTNRTNRKWTKSCWPNNCPPLRFSPYSLHMRYVALSHRAKILSMGRVVLAKWINASRRGQPNHGLFVLAKRIRRNYYYY